MGGGESKDQHAEDLAASLSSDALNNYSPRQLLKANYRNDEAYARYLFGNFAESRRNYAGALQTLAAQAGRRNGLVLPVRYIGKEEQGGLSYGNPRRKRTSSLNERTVRPNFRREDFKDVSVGVQNREAQRDASTVYAPRIPRPTTTRFRGHRLKLDPHTFISGSALPDEPTPWYDPEGESTVTYTVAPRLVDGRVVNINQRRVPFTISDTSDYNWSLAESKDREERRLREAQRNARTRVHPAPRGPSPPPPDRSQSVRRAILELGGPERIYRENIGGARNLPYRNKNTL